MLHVKQIKSLADKGESVQAHEALEQLLALGPKNTHALKIKAQLLGHEGHFAEESMVWEQIAQIDHEDEEAVQHLIQLQVEEREHFYFTDDVPGGKRFLAYPKKLISISMIGLLGCLIFLVLTRITNLVPEIADPVVTLALFSLLVLVPWLAIIVTFFRSLKWVLITAESLTVATRTRSYRWDWTGISQIYLAHSYHKSLPHLLLTIIPTAESSPVVQIDFTRESSAIRARSFLISEITRVFHQPAFTRWEALNLKNRKIKSF